LRGLLVVGWEVNGGARVGAVEVPFVVVRLLGVSSASAVCSCFVAQVGRLFREVLASGCSVSFPISEYRSIYDCRFEGYEPGGIVMMIMAVDSAAALGSVIFRSFPFVELPYIVRIFLSESLSFSAMSKR
jgi:hypothetical protein